MMSAKQKGLSLVEVLVAVAIVAILTLMSASLGSQWSSDAKVTQAKSVLQQGYTMAKAVSLQNPLAVQGVEVAATTCFKGTSIFVVAGADCAEKPFWTGELPAQTTVLLGGGAPQCIALTHSAGLVPRAGTLNCSTSLTYSISAGASNASNKTLY